MLFYLFLSIFASQSVLAIQECWTCKGNSVEECSSKGKFRTCVTDFTNMQCGTTLRERGGIVKFISMGCKKSNACENNRRQNFIGQKRNHQCKPVVSEKRPKQSVCRQCCESNRDCNLKFMTQNDSAGPMTTSAWTELGSVLNMPNMQFIPFMDEKTLHSSLVQKESFMMPKVPLNPLARPSHMLISEDTSPK